MLGLVATKVICLSVLGVASLVLGLLPLWLRRRLGPSGAPEGADCPRHAAASGPLLTALLSFGAGALLATAVVHMLAEASEQLPRAAPVAMLTGFLVMYLVDELVQRVLGHSPAAARAHRTQPHAACPVDEPCPPAATGRSPRKRWHADYGSMDESDIVERSSAGAAEAEAACLLSPQGPAGPAPAAGKQAVAAEAEGRTGQGQGAGGASCWGLLLALSIHSIIEGLAVGLESTPEQVIFLLGAVSSHKLVVAFCLGAELVGGGVAMVPHAVAVLVFAGGSAAGVGVGMALFELPAASSLSLTSDPTLVPALQASAAGTLLYVTLAEVLPRERARSQHNFPRRLLQLVSFTVGVALITALVLLMDDHHDPMEVPLGPP